MQYLKSGKLSQNEEKSKITSNWSKKKKLQKESRNFKIAEN